MATSETIGSETLYSVTDAVDDNLAAYFNGNRNGIEAALRAAASARVVVVASMTGNVTLVDTDVPVRSYSPTADRDLTLPALASTNHAWFIINRSTTYKITVKNSGGTVIGYVGQGSSIIILPEGTNGWYIPTTQTGFYTPTLTNTTNIAASTAFQCMWKRRGDFIDVDGTVNIDPTAAGYVEMGMSLPIASDLANYYELVGVAAQYTGANNAVPVVIIGDTTNNRAKFQYYTIATADANILFHFSYLRK